MGRAPEGRKSIPKDFLSPATRACDRQMHETPGWRPGLPYRAHYVGFSSLFELRDFLIPVFPLNVRNHCFFAIPHSSNLAPESSGPEPRKARAGSGPLKYLV